MFAGQRLANSMYVLGAAAIAASVVYLAVENRMLKAALHKKDAGGVPVLQVGDELFAAEIQELTGATLPLTTRLKGETIVYFFTTTCQYCAQSVAAVESIAERLADGPTRLLGVSLNDLAQTELYVADHSIAWPVVATVDRTNARALNVPAVPFVAVVRDGVVLQTWRGQVTGDRAEEIMNAVGLSMTTGRP